MLQIILVHNNNFERNRIIEIGINDLLFATEAKYIEISEQPEIKPLTAFRSFYRELVNLFLEYHWAKFHGNDYHFFGYKNFKKVKQIFRRASRQNQTHTRRLQAVEGIVTKKHLSAWQAAQEFEGFTLIFEDDALFGKNSTDRFLDILNCVSGEFIPSSDNIYFDLAGGLDLNNVIRSSWGASKFSDYVEFSKPTSNTACAYLISQKMAQNFCNTIYIRKNILLLPVDWVMNSVFMRLFKSGEYVTCRHLYPSIFDHGSQKGQFVPWRE